jgi:hypothetical protein
VAALTDAGYATTTVLRLKGSKTSSSLGDAFRVWAADVMDAAATITTATTSPASTNRLTFAPFRFVFFTVTPFSYKVHHPDNGYRSPPCILLGGQHA